MPVKEPQITTAAVARRAHAFALRADFAVWSRQAWNASSRMTDRFERLAPGDVSPCQVPTMSKMAS